MFFIGLRCGTGLKGVVDFNIVGSYLQIDIPFKWIIQNYIAPVHCKAAYFVTRTFPVASSRLLPVTRTTYSPWGRDEISASKIDMPGGQGNVRSVWPPESKK